MDDNLPIVLFSLPNQPDFTLVSGQSVEVDKIDGNFEGFVFHPFKITKENEPLFIEKNIFEQVSIFELNKFSERFSCLLDIEKMPYCANRTSFVKLVSTMQSELHLQGVTKTVASRIKTVKTPQRIDPIDLLRNLQENHPQHFNYLLFYPNKCMWIGSSPELLIEQQGKQIKTVSLAGTKKANANQDWTDKELHEQNIVTQYIKNTLASVGAFNIDIGNLDSVNAGNIEHLKTVFTAKVKDVNPMTIAQKLHPTPAVGGFPKKGGVGIVNICETHDRSYYTGFLGMIEKKQANLYVNIRCAQIFKQKILVYLGAGITADSDPEKEWVETENKANSMLKAIDATVEETAPNHNLF